MKRFASNPGKMLPFVIEAGSNSGPKGAFRWEYLGFVTARNIDTAFVKARKRYPKNKRCPTCKQHVFNNWRMFEVAVPESANTREGRAVGKWERWRK